MAARTSSKYNPAQLSALCNLAGLRIEELLAQLSIRYREAAKFFFGPCPVHGGQGPRAWNIYPDGYALRGNWKCRSRRCHEYFRSTVLGLTWGVLSHRCHNWQQPGDKTIPFREAVDYLCDFVGYRLEDVKVDLAEVEKRRFVGQQATFGRRPLQQQVDGYRREEVRQRLVLPSPYFLARGYSAGVLERYDVGDARTDDRTNPMHHRALVPVYDPNYRRIIGLTARTQWSQCQSCGLYHDATLPCPASPRAINAAGKWFHQGAKGQSFRKESCLYNLWFAREHIQQTGVAVLVESPGNIWRLHEAGICQGLGLFGCELNDEQEVLLASTGAMDVVVVMDPDEAGRTATDKIRETLRRSYRLHFPKIAGPDLGEMPVAAVANEVGRLVAALSRKA